jgi:NitT/TauT family transport system substrate-binding protein
MQSYAHNIFFVAVPKASKITRMEDLKGMKIGVVNMGAGAIVLTRSMLKMAGVPYDNSVFLPVGAGPSALQALERGTVSALSLWDSGYSSIERLGAELRYFHHPTIGFVGNAGFFMSQASAKNRREDHIRFMRAIAKARIWISRNPDQAVQIYWDAVPSSKFGETPEQQRATALREISFMNPYPIELPARNQGRFDLGGVEKYLQVMKEEGAAKADMKVEDMCSNELLDQIGAIDVENTVKRQYRPAN